MSSTNPSYWHLTQGLATKNDQSKSRGIFLIRFKLEITTVTKEPLCLALFSLEWPASPGLRGLDFRDSSLLPLHASASPYVDDHKWIESDVQMLKCLQISRCSDVQISKYLNVHIFRYSDVQIIGRQWPGIYSISTVLMIWGELSRPWLLSF